MALTLVTPPTGDLLTKGELLDWVRADDQKANAAEVMRLLLAAETSFREHTGKVLRESTWKWTRHLFPGRPFRLPWIPVRSVSLVRYRDQDYAWQTIDAADYQTWENDGGFLYLSPAPAGSWPTVGSEKMEGVEITFVAGIVATGGRPTEDIILAVKNYVARFFGKREPDDFDDNWLAALWLPWDSGEVV
jgi:uncharacterized phiE125 gp8 family phage protein